MLQSRQSQHTGSGPRRSALLLMLLLLPACGETRPAVDTGATTDFDHSHQIWTQLLEKHVRDGLVDYQSLARDPEPLNRYLARLQAVGPKQYAGWDEPQRLAFWLNAYNAYTVKLVLDHWPVESIKDIGSLLSSPFRIRFVPLESLRGRVLSLDDLEHRILRTEFQEPRIHFAIVCASTGCPPLASRAYQATQLDQQLAEQTRRYLADPERTRYQSDKNRLYLSSIFKWFREDFEKAEGSIEAFVIRHGPPDLGTALGSAQKLKIHYQNYDWTLNRQE